MWSQIKSLLAYADARLGESSTYAAIAGLLLAMGVNVPAGVLHECATWGGIVSGALGIVLAEAGNKPGTQVAADVVANVVQGIKAMPTTAAMLAVLMLGSLSACGTGAAILTDLGVAASTANTIASDTAVAGQLFCQVNGQWYAVSGATVTNATSQAVANTCTAVAAAGGTTPVPGAPPSGTVANLVSVAQTILDALNASKALI